MGLIRHLSLVVVVGHSHCGGAAACLAAAGNPPPAEPPNVPLLRWLTPLTNLVRTLGLPLEPGAALSAVVDANVRQQVQNLTKADPIKEAWAKGQNVQIHGLVYNLPTGTLADLGVTQGPGH